MRLTSLSQYLGLFSRETVYLILLLTVRTSVKLNNDVTQSPVFTNFRGIILPSIEVIFTLIRPLWTMNTFSSGSPTLNKCDPAWTFKISV